MWLIFTSEANLHVLTWDLFILENRCFSRTRVVLANVISTHFYALVAIASGIKKRDKESQLYIKDYYLRRHDDLNAKYSSRWFFFSELPKITQRRFTWSRF